MTNKSEAFARVFVTTAAFKRRNGEDALTPILDEFLADDLGDLEESDHAPFMAALHKADGGLKEVMSNADEEGAGIQAPSAGLDIKGIWSRWNNPPRRTENR